MSSTLIVMKWGNFKNFILKKKSWKKCRGILLVGSDFCLFQLCIKVLGVFFVIIPFFGCRKKKTCFTHQANVCICQFTWHVGKLPYLQRFTILPNPNISPGQMTPKITCFFHCLILAICLSLINFQTLEIEIDDPMAKVFATQKISANFLKKNRTHNLRSFRWHAEVFPTGGLHKEAHIPIWCTQPGQLYSRCHLVSMSTPNTPWLLFERTVFFFRMSMTSWWFQPLWKILVKLDHFPK